MAYYTKYRAEFKDIEEIVWKVDIQEDLVSDPGITTLTCTGNPLSFDWYGTDDILEQNVVGSKMSLNIWVPVNFQLLELFTADILKYKVIVYHGVTPYWYGYITANGYTESYDTTPYSATITATDGLGLLKEFKFVDLGYDDKQIYSTVIHDILDLVKITTFTEYVNLYNSNMDDTVDDSTFTQIGLDPDLFLTDNCYDALNTMLSTFNACIRQDKGIITIYRFNELKDSTMYGRVYTGATTHTSTTNNSLQYINRTGSLSEIVDLNGGTLSMVPQAKTLILNYNLGLKPSCLKHYEFKFDDFTETGGVYTIEDWTSANCVLTPVSIKIPGEDNGVYVFANAQYATNQYITQTIQNVHSRMPVFKITFQYKLHSYADLNTTASLHYRLINTGSSTNYWVQGIGTQLGIGTQWSLTNSGSPSNTYVTIDTVTPGWSDWQTAELIIDGVPVDGSLQFIFYAASSASQMVNVIYKDIKVVMTPIEGADETGIGYTVSAATSGRVIENEIRLGDGFTSARYAVNQILNYNGILNEFSGVTPIACSTTWYTRGNTENKPIMELVSVELGNQYELPRQLIDLPVIILGDSTYISSIGTLQDNINLNLLSDPRLFAINISSYSVRDRAYQLILTEIL